MNIFGIICEYNPFHTGHLYHISESRRLGADAIVCVMSGNYVQRADFAMISKHARAETAVRSGADLVIELPTPWAMSSAEGFARGGVSILHSLGCVTHLSYGCETNEPDLLISAAALLKSNKFKLSLKEQLKNGISFATARGRAIEEHSKEIAQLIKTPNNILAIEYLKALSETDSDIKPVAVTRRGSGHDDLSLENEYLSASAIRSLIADKNEATALPFLSPPALDIYCHERDEKRAPVWLSDADKAIMSCLKKLKPEDYLVYNDVSEGLEVRLYEAALRSTTLDEAIMHAKTKRYAYSRIRRIYLSAFLGLTSELSKGIPCYARVLAFNKIGRGLLKQLRKTASIPIITKPASVKELNDKAQLLFEFESRATDLYSLFMPQPRPSSSDWKTSPIFID